MPNYEYECQNCGRIELIQKITASPLKKCPRCGGKLKKLVSQTSFHLKGSGWYATDYAKKGKGKKDQKDHTETASATSDASKENTSPSPPKTD